MASSTYTASFPHTMSPYAQIYNQNGLAYPQDHEHEQFISPFITWSPGLDKEQPAVPQQHHQQIPHQHLMHQITNHPNAARPHLASLQTEVDHLKSLSLYTATAASPIQSPLICESHPQSAPSFLETFEAADEWHKSTGATTSIQSLHGYQSQPSSHQASSSHHQSHHHENPGSHRQELIRSPIITGFQQSTRHFFGAAGAELSSHDLHQSISQQHSPYFEQAPLAVNISEFNPPNHSPHLSQEYNEGLACDPRYVSQESGEATTNDDHHSDFPRSQEFQLFQINSPSPLQSQPLERDVRELAGDLEQDIDTVIANAAGISPGSVQQKGSPLFEQEEEADPEYDPRDADYIYRYRPSARGNVPTGHTREQNRGMQLRSTVVRYAPYPSSTNSEMYLGNPFATRSHRSVSSAPSISSVSSASSPSSSYTPLTPTSPTTKVLPRQSNSLPIPIPVPHLTKKSRGRRVPTAEVLDMGRGPGLAQNGLDNGEFGSVSNPVSALKGARGITGGRKGAAKGVRMFTCKVPGCEKCFARGEHLKRHVRSIHTHEKPHKCPYPGCNKDFSRHDNLGQHMRVHKDWIAASD